MTTLLVLYDAHADSIYRYHLARTGNVQDAQDLASETFQAALEARSSYHPRKGSLKTWVMGIAHHKLVDHFRRSGRNVDLETVAERPDGAPLPEETAHQRLQSFQVARALRRIAPDRAQAIALHFYSGLDLAETAQAMGKSSAAVKKLVQRGLEDLKRGMAFAAENRV
jgi:RNA polymerase sigma-70 factor (ECF subfamily)